MYQSNAEHNAYVAGDAKSWQYDAHAQINGGIAIAGDLAIIDTFDDRVVALDLKTGKPQWTATSDNVIMSTPVVSHGLVIVGTGKNRGVPNGGFVYESGATQGSDLWGRPEGDHILALHVADGSKAWSYRTAGEDMPSPAIMGDRVIFANGDSHAYGLNLQTGDALWRIDTDGLATMASVTVDASRAYLSVCNFANATSRTYAVTSDGKVAWSAPFGNCDSSPTVDGNSVFVSGISGNTTDSGFGGRAIVAALDARSGSLKWRYESSRAGIYTMVGSSERAIAGMADDGTYYQALPTENAFVAFDERTGRERWRVSTAGPVKMSAASHDGRIYFGDVTGIFYTVSASDGHMLSETPFHEPFTTAPPVIVGRSVIIINGTTVRRMKVQ